jgi:OOP family OmpA-OmpF porin
MISRLAAVSALVLAAAAASAQIPADEEGCRDSALLGRMTGCKVTQCEYKDFDQADVPVGPISAEGEAQPKTVEGQTEKLVYVCPANLSSLQIARNAENALKAAGFTILLSGKLGNEASTTGQKGGTWVHVHGQPWNEFSGYELTTVRTKGMTQELQVTAEGLAAEIGRSGRVAVYGINFDTGRATLAAGSDAVLEEIGRLLKANAGWRMKIEGHTDNVGSKDANQKLSEDRAAAVERWLVAHGVDKSRLTHEGFGDTRPVGDNSTEDGRARNRRVEIVKG